MARKILLMCGILAALLYVSSDILAALRWEGYSYTSQTVSELRAIEAPTRVFLVPMLILYAVLEIAFGWGVWGAARHKRSLRITGTLLITLGVFDMMGPFFPLRLSEPASGFANKVHVIVTMVTVSMILLIIGFGSAADGRWVRFYSVATLLLLIVTGVWSFIELPRIAANLPTPWLGVRERINIYGYMLWMAVLAVVLLRDHTDVSSDKFNGQPPGARGRSQLSQQGHLPV